ncbi:hypothetical protein BDW22DRAFT_1354864 [Trametopsis cervina]|nr:hypothetical protein BDW22DRAFT_1354864 [Trametopsis cervina]
MVSGRINHVVCVAANKAVAEVRAMFSQCGDIRGVYPLRGGDPRSSIDYFVEFHNPESVKRARALRLPGGYSSVQVMAFNAQMIADFYSVAPPLAPKRKRESDTEMGGSRKRNTESPFEKTRLRTSFDAVQSRSRTSNSPMRASSQSSHGYSATSRVAISYDTIPTPHINLQHRPSSKFSSFSPSRPSTSIPPPTPCVIVKTEPTCPDLSQMQDATAPRAHEQAGMVASSTILVLHYQGVRFDCDLEALTEDLDAALFMLRQTASCEMERNKWMMVAAHYRRKRNISSAIAVIFAMIEVMLSPPVGLSEEDLKPAFLMLASCYMEQRKQLLSQGVDGNILNECARKAQEYLCKVYGANSPLSMIDITSRSAPGGTPALANQTFTLDPPAQVRSLLEREVQSLRDSHMNTAVTLADLRSAKQKLEDDLVQERSARKKMEDDMRQQTHELNALRRAEKCALEQCKREVENRRKAEACAARASELADEVRMLRERLCNYDKRVRENGELEGKMRGMCARAGTLLMKASRGEFEDIGNTVGRSPSNARLLQGPMLPAQVVSLDMAPPGLSYRRERTSSASSRGTLDGRRPN